MTNPKPFSAARLGDAAQHPGAITGPCADKVLINRMPAARKGDVFTCTLPPTAGPHPTNVIAKGSMTVKINGHPAARVGDTTSCGAVISAGSPNVTIGG
jgi:uncharacterized Zn-binding protein involved in type VI secretion